MNQTAQTANETLPVLGAALKGVSSTKNVVTASPQLTRLANQLRSRLAARRG